MVEYISKALKQASYEATMLLYSPEIDPFLEEPRLTAKKLQKMKDQRTLEAFTDQV